MIRKVTITRFRNIQDKSIELNGSNLALEGQNKLGKTNILNAIYWCLCGVSLDNSCDNWKNIPFGSDFEEGIVLVSVEVEMNAGKIKREIVFEKANIKQQLTINDELCETLKDGELQIDNLLGILPLTIKQPKGFYVRRLLLNPYYINYISESVLRDYVVNKVVANMDYQSVYNELGEKTRNLLKPFISENGYDPIIIADALKKALKTTKEKVTYWKNVFDYCSTELGLSYIDKPRTEYNEIKKKLLNLEQTETAMDIYATRVNVDYSARFSLAFKGIKVDILLRDDEEWKPVFKISVPSKDLYFENGSTAEQIYTALKFNQCFREHFDNIPALPVFIDQFEVCDSKTIADLLKDIKGQFIVSKVTENNKINERKF